MLVRKVRLRVPAGAAKPGPAIGQVRNTMFLNDIIFYFLLFNHFGQALGPLGLNMADFCKQFNERTKGVVPATPTPVVLSAFNNRTFTFETKTPPTRLTLLN